jgi:hypothetical protein
MKSIILSFLLIFGLAAPNYSRPINDIFSIKDPVITEESYINDIPFDTYEIAVESILEGEELQLQDEAYIDDIPFDTKAIADKCLLNMKMKTLDESNINDLPFNTEKVFYEKLAERLTELYRDEKGTNDIPGSDYDNVCCYEITLPRSLSVIIKASVKESVRQ